MVLGPGRHVGWRNPANHEGHNDRKAPEAVRSLFSWWFITGDQRPDTSTQPTSGFKR
jgi:hypothetical protein